MAYTYILRCAENKLYVGSTTNIEERIKRHSAGYASEFTHLHIPVELVYKEEYNTYQEVFKKGTSTEKVKPCKERSIDCG